jgi:hypothetical protein
MIPKIDEAVPAGVHHHGRRAAQPDWSKLVSTIMATVLERSGNGADKSNTEGT